MPQIDITGLNVLAILAAGFAFFMLGGVWYTALFGKKWADLHGYSEEKLKQMQQARPPAIFFGGMIACYLLISTIMAVVWQLGSIESAVEGLVCGVLVWVIVAAVGMTSHIASDRHIGIYVIDSSFQLIGLALTGLVLGAW